MHEQSVCSHFSFERQKICRSPFGKKCSSKITLRCFSIQYCSKVSKFSCILFPPRWFSVTVYSFFYEIILGHKLFFHRIYLYKKRERGNARNILFYFDFFGCAHLVFHAADKTLFRCAAFVGAARHRRFFCGEFCRRLFRRTYPDELVFPVGRRSRRHAGGRFAFAFANDFQPIKQNAEPVNRIRRKWWTLTDSNR